MFWHIDTDIVGLLVMCALYIYTVKVLPEAPTVQNRAFRGCLLTGILLTVVDIAASVAMDVPTTHFLYHLFMTAYLLTQDVPILAWAMYGLTLLYVGDDRGRKRVQNAMWALYAVYALLVLSNPMTGLFFTLGPEFEYARGPLFLPAMLTLYAVYVVTLLALIYLRRRHIPAGYPQIVLVLSPVLLTVAIPIQLLNPGLLVIYPAYMICFVMAFLFFENVRARNNRAQLRQLTEMIDHFASGVAISAITQTGGFAIQYVSAGLAAICDTDVATLRARFERDILTGIHPDDREILREHLKNVAENRVSEAVTYRYITDAGDIKWIHVATKIVSHEDATATVYATYTDLTEQKRAEQLVDVALKNTGVSIWEYDFKRRCIIQYQNSTQMHGFETIVANVPESLIDTGFVHPDSAPAFQAMYDKLFAGEPFAEGIFKVQTNDRKSYWYEHIRYTNGFDEHGKPNRAVGMSTDETEKQETIAKYERELEIKRVAMTEESLIVSALFNLTTGETLEYRFQDGIPVPEEDRASFTFGRGANLLIDEKERDAFLALNNRENLLARFEAGETEFRMEYRRPLPDGQVGWVRNTLHLLRDPKTGHLLLFEYWYDIEKEKMQELMYRSIANDNYDFVARIDGASRRFDVLAKAGLTYHMPPLSGEDADKVTMSLYDECVAQEDRERVIENSLVGNVLRHLRAQGRFVFTYRMTYPDGAAGYKRVTQYLIDPQREIIAMMREDVTDLLRAEAEKSRLLSDALDAAKQASRAKSQFLSRVSHELRTPLNAIIGFMELAKDASHEQAAICLANSNAAARQLLSIINDVLDVSSIEAGKLRIAHAPFDFKNLIKGVTDVYVAQCRQKKDLVYDTVLLTPVDEWLIGDQLRVNQILLNLLGNAVKFTESGHIWLRVAQLPARSGKVIVRFEIADTGCGMSEEMQKRLFKPFEQESAATAQKYGGNGLGLSIVGSLVQMMDGVIHVESQLGAGSTFTVDLPFSKSDVDIEADTVDGAEKLRILSVDDLDVERDYIDAVLRRMDVRHTCVTTGQAVLDELERGEAAGDPYNVCLVDWKMPDMNGLETTRRIRAHYGKELVVIVVSAYDHYQADESAKAAGANMFISKPLFQSTLFNLIMTLTGGRIAKEESIPETLNLSDMRILLAEDNLMNRMVAENLIAKKIGAQCESAPDGQAALDMFLASPAGHYDAILMDIQMPNMDGYEATRQIRASAHPDAASVQIIALTANAFMEDIAQALSVGMNAHVSKPIEVEDFTRVLTKAYRASRSAAEPTA